MYKYCLFDLDGTLTDPKEGICKSAQYGLHKMGIEEPDIDKLEPFIGPPLWDSFMQFYGMSREDADKAVKFYRERFSTVGLYENEVYDGVADMLDALKDRGVMLAVASSKPTDFVEKILEHFDLARFFDAVVGSNMDGTRSAKSEVVEEALLSLYFGKEHTGKKLMDCEDKMSETAMIGDRKFDIEGAHAMGIVGIGVEYGYAAKGELREAGADRIAKTVTELEAILLGENVKEYVNKKKKAASNNNKNNVKNLAKNEVKNDSKKELADRKQKAGFLLERSSDSLPVTSFQKSLYVLTPFLLYYMVRLAVSAMGPVIVDVIQNSDNDRLKEILIANQWLRFGGISILALVVAIIVMIGIYHKTDRLKLQINGYMPLAAVAGTTLALGLNLLTGLICKLTGIQSMMDESSYDKNMPLAILFIFGGIVSPIAEELCFRYLLYGRMKRIYGFVSALIMSSLFFGIYHGHLIQGIYAFIMGASMVLVYEWAESLLAPIAFHMFANIGIITSPYLPSNVQKVVGSNLAIILWILFGVGTMLVLKKWNDTRKVTE